MHKISDIILKVPRKVYWVLLVLLLLIDAIAFDLSPLLQKIEIWDIAAAYNSLISIFPEIAKFAAKLKYLFLLVTAINVILLLYKPRLFLIRHTSFSPNLGDIESDFLKNYYIKKINIDQTDMVKNSIPSIDAILKQDNRAANLIRTCKSSPLCYYGIAHTPLVFRLGFMLGDQSNIKLLHKRRSNDSLFKEWNHEKDMFVITSNELNAQIDSNELIAAISTSQRITEQDIKALHPLDRHVIFFESNNIGFDCITSYEAAENAKNTIMQIIRDLAKKYSIQKIHLVIASSTAFTFFLAQSFSSQHEPVTIVYHYQNGTYPWGICLNERAAAAFVFTS